MRENKVEKYLHRRAKQLKGTHRRLAYLGRRGATDDLILLPGRHLIVECKATDVEPEEHQSREHVRLIEAGFELHVIDSFEDVDRILPLPTKG